MNTISIVYDILTLLIILWFVYIGYRKGIVESILSLVGKIVALVGAIFVSGPLADLAYKTFVHTRLVGYVQQNIVGSIDESMVVDNLEGILSIFSDKSSILEPIARTMSRIPGFAGGQSTDYSSAEQSFLELMNGGAGLADAITQSTLTPTISMLLQAVMFLIVFVIFSLIISAIVSASGIIKHVPVVNLINSILGGAFGVVSAMVMLYIGGIILALIIAATGGGSFLSLDILENTVVLSRIIYFRL